MSDALTPITTDVPTPLAGFYFLECKTQNPLVEMWKAHTADGVLKTVKLISGLAYQRVVSAKELEQATHLKFIKHPRLVPIEQLATDQGRLVIVEPYSETSLRDRFRDFTLQGKPGLPREDLIEHLAAMAEALDYLDRQEGLHHLSLSPSCMVFIDETLRLSDYGLVELAWLPAGQPLDQNSMRYAAPEVFDNHFTGASDQYSLALIYCELLTGRLPHRGNMVKQMRASRIRGQLDLDLIPAHDVDAVRHALERDPAQRFPSNTAFVEALRERSPRRSARPEANRKSSRIRQIGPLTPTNSSTGMNQLLPQDALRVVNQLVQLAAFTTVVKEQGGIRFQVDEKGVLSHRCAAWLPAGMALHKLQGFADQWQATIVRDREDAITFEIDLPQNFWQKYFQGHREYLQIDVLLQPTRGPESKLTEVTIQMSYRGHREAEGRKAVQNSGPAFLYSLRTYLLATSEHRIQERFRFDYPLWVSPLAAGQIGEPLGCQGRNISPHGIGFISPVKLPMQDVLIQVHTTELGKLSVPATIIRSAMTADGTYEIGARFKLPPTAPVHPL